MAIVAVFESLPSTMACTRTGANACARAAKSRGMTSPTSASRVSMARSISG